MLLHEIKQLKESTSYPDISIERHPDAGYVVVDRNTYDGAPDGNRTLAHDQDLETALSELGDKLVDGGYYDEATVDDAIRTAYTVFQHEQTDDHDIQDERPRVEIRESMVTNYGQAMRLGFAVVDKRTHDIVPATFDIQQKRVRLDVHDDLQKYVVVSVTSDGIVPQSDWAYNYS